MILDWDKAKERIRGSLKGETEINHVLPFPTTPNVNIKWKWKM